MIRKTVGVCGGSARVQDTRITVRTLVLFHQQGTTDDQLLKFYPSLKQPDLEDAWDYYKNHSAEIDQEIQDNEDRQQLTERELATVLAALRHWQRVLSDSAEAFEDIATDGGRFEPLSVSEIDKLCMRLNHSSIKLFRG